MTELTDSASFLGYALVIFIVGFYLPHVTFKFCAELRVDLGWRRDATRLEEFVGAAIPSVLFNLFAWFAYEVLCALPWLDSYDVDWAVVASLVGSDKGALADFIYAGDLRSSIGLYLALLYIIAAIHGFLFGYAVYERLRSGDEPFESLEKILAAPADWPLVLTIIGWFWSVFYAETLVPFFHWTARETWLMVRTVDGRLYHGRFVRYDTGVNGAIDIIKLDEVHRYAPDELLERFRRGRIAVTNFRSPLYLKWSRIADIHHVEKSHIFDIMLRQYLDLNELRAEIGLPKVPPPENLDLSEEMDEEDEEIAPSPS